MYNKSKTLSTQITDIKAEPELLINDEEFCDSNDALYTSDAIESPTSNHDRKPCSFIDLHLKPYVCDYEKCGKRYQDIGRLTVHKRSHTGVLTRVCLQ